MYTFTKKQTHTTGQFSVCVKMRLGIPQSKNKIIGESKSAHPTSSTICFENLDVDE